MRVCTPSKATLRKYGLTEAEWRGILERQGGVCFVCEKLPKSGRLHVDHEHVHGWKDMRPEQRKQWVRGLLCWFCNHHYVGRAITIQKATRVVLYLTQHETRKIKENAG